MREQATQLLLVLRSGWVENSLVAAVAFMCRGTARSTGSNDASSQMHLRIAIFVHVTYRALYKLRTIHTVKALTNVYLYIKKINLLYSYLFF